MSKDLEYYRGLPYTRRARPVDEEDERFWLAWVEELSGCKVEGSSKAEAFANLSEHFDEYIEAKLEWDSVIPEPTREERQSAPDEVSPEHFVFQRAAPADAHVEMEPVSPEEADSRAYSGDTSPRDEEQEKVLTTATT